MAGPIPGRRTAGSAIWHMLAFFFFFSRAVKPRKESCPRVVSQTWPVFETVCTTQSARGCRVGRNELQWSNAGLTVAASLDSWMRYSDPRLLARVNAFANSIPLNPIPLTRNRR